MSSGADIALVALVAARELLMAYFRMLELSGLSPEEKLAHYEKVRAEFMLVDRDAIRKPEDLK
jgi:hypothetical protein